MRLNDFTSAIHRGKRSDAPKCMYCIVNSDRLIWCINEWPREAGDTKSMICDISDSKKRFFLETSPQKHEAVSRSL